MLLEGVKTLPLLQYKASERSTKYQPISQSLSRSEYRKKSYGNVQTEMIKITCSIRFSCCMTARVGNKAKFNLVTNKSGKTGKHDLMFFLLDNTLDTKRTSRWICLVPLSRSFIASHNQFHTKPYFHFLRLFSKSRHYHLTPSYETFKIKFG